MPQDWKKKIDLRKLEDGIGYQMVINEGNRLINHILNGVTRELYKEDWTDIWMAMIDGSRQGCFIKRPPLVGLMALCCLHYYILKYPAIMKMMSIRCFNRAIRGVWNEIVEMYLYITKVTSQHSPFPIHTYRH